MYNGKSGESDRHCKLETTNDSKRNLKFFGIGWILSKVCQWFISNSMTLNETNPKEGEIWMDR